LQIWGEFVNLNEFLEKNKKTAVRIYKMDGRISLLIMRIEEFNYTLPPSLIAQYPSPQRGETRLMVLDRNHGTIVHRPFSNILNYLRSGDLLVLNNTRVLPARLIGEKETGGRCEILFLPSWNGNQGEWRVLVKGSGKIKGKTRIRFKDGSEGDLLMGKDGTARIDFSNQTEITEILQKIGHIPLPPYIKREDSSLDRDRYQTVYAERDGSIAAPTAGLHFTHSLFQSLKDQGVQITKITLHIGIGTFARVKVREIENHSMAAEWVEVSEETAREIKEAKRRGGRVVAVGTTTTRALESFSDGTGGVKSGKGMVSLVIYPPYRFLVIDGLVTNFHLPKSTLIMLIAAFAGKDFIMKAYKEAIERKYRFYSYGDAMLIL
jgi:S-adenosylmethionine:tRNA ribosyltransferase-isomerase